MVYDITRRETFNHLNNWLRECRSNGNESMTILLIGNKSDLEHKRAVSYEEGNEFARANGLTFMECSAKDSTNINEAFLKSAEIIMEKMDKGIIDIENDMSGVRPVNYVIGPILNKLSKMTVEEESTASNCPC